MASKKQLKAWFTESELRVIQSAIAGRILWLKSEACDWRASEKAMAIGELMSLRDKVNAALVGEKVKVILADGLKRGMKS